MKIEERTEFFVEYLGDRDTTGDEYKNPQVRGERSPFVFLNFETIPSPDFVPTRFPPGCKYYKIRIMKETLIDGVPVRPGICKDISSLIPVDNSLRVASP